MDHRRIGARYRRTLHQSRLKAERGVRRPSSQAKGFYPRDQEHRAGRGDQLRLRYRLLQGLSEADRLQMRGLRKEAQEEARRGAGRTAAPESQGGEEVLEESREAGGKGRGTAWAERRQAERREAERQAPERAGRKIRC